MNDIEDFYKNRQEELYAEPPYMFIEYVYRDSKEHPVLTCSAIMGYVARRYENSKRDEDCLEDVDILLSIFSPSHTILVCSEALLLATQMIKDKLTMREYFNDIVQVYFTDILGVEEATTRLSYLS